METIATTQRPYADINVIEPVSSHDEECIAELRAVLKRHGRLHRFGISLLHTHFDMTDDEILLETCDDERRTLTIRPVKKSELDDADLIFTNWSLGQEDALQACSKKDHVTALQACSKKDHATALQACSKKDHVTALQACSKKDHVTALQACTKKDHVTALQACTKKDHVTALQACTKKDHATALQACSKKDHVTSSSFAG
jgi:hypothetical protein